MPLLAAALVTLLAAVALTPVVRAAARRVGAVVVPRTDSWHRRPTALLGGLAIYGAFLIGLALWRPDLTRAAPVLVAATLLLAVGLLDDFVRITPPVKLGAQVAAAGLVVGAGLRLPWTASVAVNDTLTLLWLVGITNAVNLLDNMDGLAAGIAAIACAFLAVTFVLNGQGELAFLPALLGGATAGFLVFNFKPASIFMGDCGSMFLGAALGGIALLGDYGRARSVAAGLLTPVLILMIPILDTCLVTVTRKLAGRPVSHGGRDHASHRLVALGASEQRAVLTLYVLATLSGLCAVALHWLETNALVVLLPAFVLAVVAFALYLGRIRPEPDADAPTAATGSRT